MKRAFGTILIALLFVLRSVPASATTIEFTATDLGGDRWLYEYFLSGRVFSEGQGFTVFFDYMMSSALQLEAPSPGDANWGPLVIQPDLALKSDGYYDALALTTDPPLAGPFQVSFLWLGTGTPGSQRFEIYREQDLPGFIEEGRTTPVPEPSTLLLVVTGAGLARLLRKRSRSPVAVD